MAHAYLRHNDERNSEDMKLVAEDTENDQFVLEFGDDGPPDNVADRYDDVADNVADGDDGPPDNVADRYDDVADDNDDVADEDDDKFFPERRYGDNDAKINSDNVADGDDGPPDNVADDDDE